MEIANPMNEEQILAPFNHSMPASVDQIIKALEFASESYYNGRSVVSDPSYDALVNRLRDLSPYHPFLAQVGAPPPKHRGEVPHQCHMGSLHHINGEMALEQFKAWHEKWCEGGSIHWSLKIDGSSVALVYQNRKLVQAITRGDGFVGMDITANAIHWKGIPLEIPYDGKVVVRAEAALPVEVWKGEFFDASEPTNPRNVGNGIICRSSDPDLANKHIVPVALSCSMDNPPFSHINEMFALLLKMGFEVPENGTATNWQHARSLYQDILDRRERLKYQIDGIVWSVCDTMTVERAGFTDNRPNAQVALKFPTERKTTKVRNISLSMGHTGAIIPTADLDTVMLAGTKVSRALLNNFVYMEGELGGIGIGDTVEVEKGGDIIPHIVRVVERAGQMYYKPTECPWCDSHLSQDGRRLKCLNDECDGKVLKQIKNWITKTGMKHLGDVYLKALVDRGIVTRIQDLYAVSLANLQGVQTDEDRALGMKRASTILAEINKTKSMTVDIFMSALGISGLGLERAQSIGYRRIEQWLGGSFSDFCTAYGTGMGAIIHASLQRKIPLIQDLIQIIEVLPYTPPEARGDALKDVGICFSTCRPTAEEKAFIESQGGIIQSGVSAKTKILVMKNPEEVTTKTQAAQKHGTTIISYEHFQKILKQYQN